MSLIKKTANWIEHHELLCSILVIALVGLIAYVPFARDAGYYVDDYHLIYGGYTGGAEKIIDSYIVDRPGAGYVLGFLYQVFGPHIHFYQAYVILLEIGLALTVLWMMHSLFPKQKALAFSAAILTVVYPGFTEQLASFNYSLMLTAIFFYILSITLTIEAIKCKHGWQKPALILASALLSLGSIFMIEYYMGLEVMRFAVIYLLINRERRPDEKRVKVFIKSIVRYLPFLLAVILFVVWRFFVFLNVRGATDLGSFIQSFLASPVYESLSLLLGVFSSFIKITLLAWFEPLYRNLNLLRLKDILVILAFAMTGAAILFFYFKKWQEEKIEKAELYELLLVGVLSVLGAVLPIVFANREPDFTEYSRYSLTGMVGGILILGAFLNYFIKPSIRPVLLAFLIFSGLVTQLGAGKNFANEWQNSKTAWWQLAWRAPSLAEGTVLTGTLVGVPFEEGFFMWGPASMIYYPEADYPKIPAETLNMDFIRSIQMGKGGQRDFRKYWLEWRANDLLVISRPSTNSCLHIINGQAPTYSLSDPAALHLIGGYSHLDQVDVTANGTTPPAVIFGEEPAHDWCYYYEKADLALQKGDFAEVLRLGEEAEQNGYHPDDKIEWLPFILANAVTGNTAQVENLLTIYFDNPYHKIDYCANLTANAFSISEDANRFLFELSCTD